MTKLLIISYNFPPDNAPAAQRPASFLKYCSTDILVLTPTSTVSALGADTIDIYKDDPRVIRSGSVSVLRGSMAQGVKGANKKSWKKRIFNELKIPDKSIVWYRSALKAGQAIIDSNKDITHLFSSSPSVVNHMVARKLAKKNKLKWIADFRDYYYIETIEKGDYIFRQHIDKRIEQGILNNADSVTFISNWMRKEYTAKYPFIADKSMAIYNGFDSAEFGEEAHTLPNKLTIFYAGTFYDGLRSPIPLFKSLDRLANEGKLDLDKIRIEVAGRISEELLDRISKFQSAKCFKFLGLLPRTEILQKYRQCHILWLIIGDQLNHYSGFPIKGYEYMGSGRPILLYTPIPSEGASIVKSIGAGYVIDTRDNSNSDNVLLNMYKDYISGKLEETISPEHLSIYTRQYQAKQLDKLINEIR